MAARLWGRGVAPVGVAAIHGGAKRALGDGAGAGERFGNGGRHALALARPHGGGKGRFGDFARGQGHGAGQQGLVGQAAQADAQAVAAGAGGKARTQIGPGFAQAVFVQRQLAAFGAHAFGEHERSGVGQARLGGEVTAAAGVKVDLHVQHGNGRAGGKPDLRAAGQGEVLNGRGGLGAAGPGQQGGKSASACKQGAARGGG